MHQFEIMKKFLPGSSVIEDMDDFLEKVDLNQAVAIIKKMPVKCSWIMVLKYVDEYTDEKIAKILKIQVKSVKKHLEKAKKRFYKDYKKQYLS